jgi:hypothetical protein
VEGVIFCKVVSATAVGPKTKLQSSYDGQKSSKSFGYPENKYKFLLGNYS